MKTLGLLFVLLLASESLFAQSAEDTAAIKAAALNYVEGWYEGNADRMAKAVHPKLAKRIIRLSKEAGSTENVLQEMNGDQLVEGTRKGYGKDTPPEKQIKNITILNIYHNSSSVQAEMSDWIDYMHIGRWNGEWKIINVLWEMKPKQ